MGRHGVGQPVPHLPTPAQLLPLHQCGDGCCILCPPCSGSRHTSLSPHPPFPCAALPHYTEKEWDWLRGALATVDRNYGILTYFHHRQVIKATVKL